ncbi:dihydrofolate reductase family protein [Comamonas sp. GB3 AK4-5]|uniref:dihydrofolate reductase family protein n=1 Tax=Comamonas sp. GB3 AK4-5 TaxID=3231487 RepID=UPI00351F393E
MATAHVFIATSLDGFIARPDGSLDWLLQRDHAGEDHGYTDFMADKDAIVMGHGTYTTVADMKPWPYDRPAYVLTKTLAGTPVPESQQGKVFFLDLTPQELLAKLAREQVQKVYVDGGKLVQSFLREGLVQDMVITTVPVLIGAGRPLFGALAKDIDLELVSSQRFPSGMVQCKYRVLP